MQIDTKLINEMKAVILSQLGISTYTNLIKNLNALKATMLNYYPELEIGSNLNKIIIKPK